MATSDSVGRSDRRKRAGEAARKKPAREEPPEETAEDGAQEEGRAEDVVEDDASKRPFWRRRPGLTIGAAVMFVIIVGTMWSRASAREARCKRIQNQTSEAIDLERFSSADAYLGDSVNYCGSDDKEKLDALASRLASARVAAEEARIARAQAKAEQRAVARFPTAVATIGADLDEAKAALAARNTPKAAAAYSRARSQIDGFRGTTIEQTDQWKDLDIRARIIEPSVQPHLDKQAAVLAEAKKKLEEEAEEDSRAGVMVTKSKAIASPLREKIEQFVKYAVANDREGQRLLVEHDPEIVILQPGTRVVPFERRSGLVHVRVKGTLAEVWVLEEAIGPP